MANNDNGHTSLIRILSLDGGGVRGLSSLLILRDLMERVARRRGETERRVRPRDCFDFIIGTGTGGLSALFLGRMGMSVDDAINEYIRVANTAFKPKSPAWISSIFGAETAKLDGAVLEDVLGEVIERFTGDRNASLTDPELTPGEHQCRTAVLAANSHYVDAPPYEFRSYNGNTALASPFTICDAARATVSTAGFFDPVTLGTPPMRFTDAGTAGYNNPSETALTMAEQVWPGRMADFRVVSLGTGLQKIVSLDGKGSKLVDACQALVKNCEQVHDRLQGRVRDSQSYFRINVDRGLDEVDIMEWEQAGPEGNLTGITAGYLRWKEVETRLNSCVDVIIASSIGTRINRQALAAGPRERLLLEGNNRDATQAFGDNSLEQILRGKNISG